MTDPKNPLGVRNFTHDALARLPEYRALAIAADDLIKAIRREEIDLDQQGFAQVVRDVAITLGFADDCREHRRIRSEQGFPELEDWREPAAFPHRVELTESGTWVRAYYFCDRGHGPHQWMCGWSPDAPLHLD